MADKTNGITKMEGVRRALKELGKDAAATAIQSFVKDRFGMDMTKDHIYVARGQVLRQDAKRKAAGKPAARMAANRTGAASRAGSASRKAREAGISKLEGVRRALRKLGKSAGSEAIQAFLKDNFNLELTRERITKYKSLVLSKARRARKKNTARASKEMPEVQLVLLATPAATGKKSGAGKAGVHLEDIQTVKALVKRVGPDQLQTLIDLLDK